MEDISSYFLKYKRAITISLILLYGCINAWIASVSKLADFHRTEVDVLNWEPYVWEFSSFIMTFILIYYIAKAQSIHPLKYGKFKKHLGFHVIHSVIFSLLHVVGMVMIRKVIYMINDKTYDFGHWPTELFYEYRKDILSYFFILSGIYVYQMIIKQIQGDASLVSEQNNVSKKTDKLLIKKKGKEFIISLNQVSSIESGGNYVYIHSNKQVYPMRSTMNKMARSLDSNQFIRVHRSYIVNIDHIKEIIASAQQEYKILMKNSSIIPLSRKQRPLLLASFHR